MEKPKVTQPKEPRGEIRTTVSMPRSLHRKLMHASVDTELPLTEIILEACNLWLNAQPSPFGPAPSTDAAIDRSTQKNRKPKGGVQ